MGRYETIGTTIEMKKVYDGDLVAEMREKYRMEGGWPEHKICRRNVNRACDLAEKVETEKDRFSEEEWRGAMIWFGICLDAERYRLDVDQAAVDLKIDALRTKIHEMHAAERAQMQKLLDKSRELISDEEWERIKEEYRIQKDWRVAVTDFWHKVIVGQAVRLAKVVIANGGTEEEVKLAVTYLKVCIEVNRYLLDYKKFKQMNGVVELCERFGVQTN